MKADNEDSGKALNRSGCKVNEVITASVARMSDGSRERATDDKRNCACSPDERAISGAILELSRLSRSLIRAALA